MHQIVLCINKMSKSFSYSISEEFFHEFNMRHVLFPVNILLAEMYNKTQK